MGANTQKYAEGILEVCSFCLRAPAAFVAGVGGSHLSQRIERILRRSTAAPTALSARVLLAGAVMLTIGAPLAAGMSQVYRPGNGVTQPKLVHEVKPRYTAEAMRAKIQGTVGLEAVVLEDGIVGDVQVTRSLDAEYGLDDQAVKAVKQWRFEPGTKDQKPVAVLIEVEMSFSLKR